MIAHTQWSTTSSGTNRSLEWLIFSYARLIDSHCIESKLACFEVHPYIVHNDPAAS